jgi:hypothetical protein
MQKHACKHTSTHARARAHTHTHTHTHTSSLSHTHRHSTSLSLSVSFSLYNTTCKRTHYLSQVSERTHTHTHAPTPARAHAQAHAHTHAQTNTRACAHTHAHTVTVSGARFGGQQADGGLVTPCNTRHHESVTFSSTARAELEAAGIHDAFHSLLLSAGLDLETLQVCQSQHRNCTSVLLVDLTFESAFRWLQKTMQHGMISSRRRVLQSRETASGFSTH